jgi:hypothetical protein
MTMPFDSENGNKFDGLIAFYPTPPGGDPSGEERERMGRKLSQMGLDIDSAGVLDTPVCAQDDSISAEDDGPGACEPHGEASDGSEAEDERMLLRLGANGF